MPDLVSQSSSLLVFISYSTDDGLDKAKQAARVLEQKGHEAWMWEHNKTIGAFPWEEISEIIYESDVVLYLCTRCSIKSWGQRREMAYAIPWRKKIIIVRLDSAPVPRVLHAEIRESLQSSQFGSGLERIASELPKTIERIQRLEQRVTAGASSDFLRDRE